MSVKASIPDTWLATAARQSALALGLVKAARAAGVSPMTLATVAAALPGHRSTHELVSDRLLPSWGQQDDSGKACS